MSSHPGSRPSPTGRLVLIRHGETEWSRLGRHTGSSDLPLTAKGEADAARLRGRLADLDLGLVLSSDLQRARRTAALAGLRPEVTTDLREWDYGGYEGRTTSEIREELGHPWDVFVDGVVAGTTPGETVEEVAARASRVISRVLPALESGDVCLVAHGHMLRILTAVWLQASPRFGAQLTLDAGSVSMLSHYHEAPCILSWNVTT